MNVATEFLISLFVQLLILAFFVGIYVSTIKNIEKQMAEMKLALKEDKEELKQDMRKYNSVLERMIINEQSVKSAHHRIDRIEESDYTTHIKPREDY